MPRRLSASIALCTILLGAPSLATASEGPPVAGCPSGGRWAEAPIPEGGTGSFDQNGDGIICEIEAPLGSGIYTIIDNVVR